MKMFSRTKKHWFESVKIICTFVLVRKANFFYLSEKSVSVILKFLVSIFVLWVINSCSTSVFLFWLWFLAYLVFIRFRIILLRDVPKEMPCPVQSRPLKIIVMLRCKSLFPLTTLMKSSLQREYSPWMDTLKVK